MNPNTGGPAFPQPNHLIDTDRGREEARGWMADSGMTLLDWMAGQALAGLYGAANDQSYKLRIDGKEPIKRSDVAKDCYSMASAMLAEKARRGATGKQDLQVDDHFRDATKMIPDPFAEDTLRRLAADVLPADIKDAAKEERLTWCAEQVRARVNTLEALNRELVNALEKFIEAGFGFSTSPAMRAEAYNKACEILAKAKEVA